MGSWNAGLFGNDDAADLLDDLADAEPAKRKKIVRKALRAAVDCDDYLDVDDANRALAAAAVVAAARTGRPVRSSNGSEILAAADLPAATEKLLGLARAAADRVVGEESEWRELWEESDQLTEALATVDEVRAALR